MDRSGEQRVEEAEGSEDDAERVDADRAGEVLPDDSARPSRDGKRFDEAFKVVSEQHHVGALLRHVRAGPHGDTDIGLSQRRGVVDAVADHGDDTLLRHEGIDAFQLVLRQQFRFDLPDAESSADCARHALGVTRQQNGPNAHALQGCDSIPRFRPDCIRNDDAAEENAVTGNEDLRSRAAAGMAGCIRLADVPDAIIRHPGTVADEDHGIINLGGDAAPRRVAEATRLGDLAALLADVGKNGLAERMLGAQLGRCRRIEQLRIGNGLSKAEIGPLVSEAARDRVIRLVEDARARGATVVTGGRIPDSEPVGWFYEPTILTGCSAGRDEGMTDG